MARIVIDPVTRIEGHPARARSQGSLDLGPADLRRLHHGSRAGLGARGRRCTRYRSAGQRQNHSYLEIEQKYSWLKAPRYDGMAMEVGPLARMVVAYAAGHPDVKQLVNGTLAKLKAQPEALFSTLGRIAARAIEAQLMVGRLSAWIDELDKNMSSGNLRIHAGEKWDPQTWPKTARGFGFHEAPRGALAHWVEIENRQIKNYQAVVPTTWNAGPRDAKGQRGPYELSLLKTPIADPERPLEILRTIHSFDPCLACAVHVLDARGKVCITKGCAG